MSSLVATFGGSSKDRAPSTNLVGHWKVGDGTGTALADSSGNGNTLTAPGALSAGFWANAGYGVCGGVDDDFFHATQSALALGNRSFLAVVTFTKAAPPVSVCTLWAKQNSTAGNYGSGLYLLSTSGGLRYEVRSNDGTGPFNLVDTANNYCDGAVHQVIVAVDVTGNRNLYADGSGTAVTSSGLTDMSDPDLVKTVNETQGHFSIAARGIAASDQFPLYDASGNGEIHDMQLYIPTVGDGLPSTLESEIIPWLWAHPGQALSSEQW